MPRHQHASKNSRSNKGQTVVRTPEDEAKHGKHRHRKCDRELDQKLPEHSLHSVDASHRVESEAVERNGASGIMYAPAPGFNESKRDNDEGDIGSKRQRVGDDLQLPDSSLRLKNIASYAAGALEHVEEEQTIDYEALIASMTEEEKSILMGKKKRKHKHHKHHRKR